MGVSGDTFIVVGSLLALRIYGRTTEMTQVYTFTKTHVHLDLWKLDLIIAVLEAPTGGTNSILATAWKAYIIRDLISAPNGL